MTPKEALVRETIRRTLEVYTLAGDSGRIDEMVAAFTDDGVLETGGAEYRGHEALRQFLSGVGAEPRQPRPERFFVRHHLTTVQIQSASADEAAGRCYFLALTPIGLDHAGRYADRYRLVGDDWLIARRKITLDWAAADSMVGAKVRTTRPGEV